MALTSRITLKGTDTPGPEDYLSTSLGVLFPDDVTNQHGDEEHSLLYASPYLPRPLAIELAEPEGDLDRTLFSHFLWNASLLLAEFIEGDSLPVVDGHGHGHGSKGATSDGDRGMRGGLSFDVRGLDLIELGAGTALPTMMAGLLGARSIVVTDYPAPAVMKTLQRNISQNLTPEHSPTPSSPLPPISIHPHVWGTPDLPSTLHQAHDRILIADCLWMPWQHSNLHASITSLLRKTASARAWVVAGFHTGREKLAAFFEEGRLRGVGLEVEAIWERDCDGVEREWRVDRVDGVSERKRWLVVAVLRWVRDARGDVG